MWAAMFGSSDWTTAACDASVVDGVVGLAGADSVSK